MATDSAGPKLQQIGREVPDFSLEDLTGAARSLRGELGKQKAAVVVFWSCVCSHCVRYDEYLRTFPERHPDIALLAVASRQQETPGELRRAAHERRLPFPILIDPGGRLARQWFTEQTPRAFLIAAGLSLQYRGAIDNFQFSGDPDYVAYLEPAISDLLAGRPVAQPDTASFGCAIQSVYYQLQKIL
ncbi:MAG: redoxin domain-containing protein [Bryobacteraceae bacterium]